MIEVSDSTPAGITAIRPVGVVHGDDFRDALLPVLENAIHDDRPLRMLIELDRAFLALTPAAAFEQLELLWAMPSVEGVAIVTDLTWARPLLVLARRVLPFPVRTFPSGQREQALGWLRFLPRQRDHIGPGADERARQRRASPPSTYRR